jgi:hypothetical protein
MNALRGKEQAFSRTALEKIIVDGSTVSECTLSYRGVKFSYLCEADKPLVWENMWLGAVFLEMVPKPYLDDAEYQALKARAYTKMKIRRMQDGYEDDGLGLKPASGQFELFVSKLP